MAKAQQQRLNKQRKNINILLQAVDVGCAIFIHTFAAYFGLAISWVLYKKSVTESKREVTTNNNDLFAMVRRPALNA